MSIRPSGPLQIPPVGLVEQHPLACFLGVDLLCQVPVGSAGHLSGRPASRVGLRWYLVVLILPLLALLPIGLSILLGGPAPIVDSSVIAVLGMFVFSIFPGSALGERSVGEASHCPIPQNDHRALTAALVLGPIWGFWYLPLWLTDSGSNPLILFPAFVLSAIALSVLLAWISITARGSLLQVVLLHATANLPVTLLIAPLGIDIIHAFLIFTALLIIAAIAVIGMIGSTNLSRSEDVPTVPTTLPELTRSQQMLPAVAAGGRQPWDCCPKGALPTILANPWVNSACAFNIEANHSISLTCGDDASLRCSSATTPSQST